MNHYSCLTCIKDAGFPEWYLAYAVKGEPTICCTCDRVTTEWIPCRPAPGMADAETFCAGIHVEDVM